MRQTSTTEPDSPAWERSRLEAVEQLARGVAHDLNNVLAVVTALSDLLIRQRPEGDPDRDDLQEILTAARRGADITRLLTAFGPPRPGDPTAIRAAAHLRSREKMIRRLLSEDVRLEWELDELEVQADPTHLDQAILPLIWSRRDDVAGGGSVRIALRNHPAPAEGGAHPRVSIAVTTTPSTVAPDSRRAPAVPASVVAAAAAMGGSVHASSSPRGGYRVEVLLPAAVEPPPEAGAAPDSPTGTETILVVEDDAPLRRGIRRALEPLGYRVVDAADGARALALIAEGGVRPNLVVTDVVLPALSGPALRDRLRELGVGAPVIFLTGYPHHPTLERLRESGATVLDKPVPTPDLVRAIRSALDAAADAPHED